MSTFLLMTCWCRFSIAACCVASDSWMLCRMCCRWVEVFACSLKYCSRRRRCASASSDLPTSHGLTYSWQQQHGQVDKHSNEWMNEWVSEWVSEWILEWVSEWVSEWMFEWVSEWVSEWESEWVSELLWSLTSLQESFTHLRWLNSNYFTICMY